MPRVVGALQARVSSSRLPGKVLAPLGGVPMLAFQLRRLARARRLDGLVVATSTLPEDDAVAELARREGVACHRGSLEDVLDRIVSAMQPAAPTHVVRLTGDCPFADPAVVDAVVDSALATGADYASNTNPPSFPDGLDVEVVRWEALLAAHAEAVDPPDREHVTLFIHRRPERFRCVNHAHAMDLSAHRWTVDEPQDLAFVRAVVAALAPGDTLFGMADVLALLAARPDILALNAGIGRNEGLERSLARWAALRSAETP